MGFPKNIASSFLDGLGSLGVLFGPVERPGLRDNLIDEADLVFSSSAAERKAVRRELFVPTLITHPSQVMAVLGRPIDFIFGISLILQTSALIGLVLSLFLHSAALQPLPTFALIFSSIATLVIGVMRGHALPVRRVFIQKDRDPALTARE